MNKYAILGLLFVSSLSADKIGNVDYRLPSNNWEMMNEMNNDNSSTKIFVPKNSQNEGMQFFSVHTNTIPAPKDINEASIKESLDPMFPGQTVEVKILKRDGNSIIYRWDTENLHGITRLFATPNGTTMLSYHTENPEYLQGDFLDHMKATLQDAKLNQ